MKLYIACSCLFSAGFLIGCWYATREVFRVRK